MRFNTISEAIEELKRGNPVLIFDAKGREEEVDMVFYAGTIDYEKIYKLRMEAGGLICYASLYSLAERIDLKFMADILSSHENYREIATRRLGYGDPPAFSLWVNYINVRTGINDKDRALTIRKLHEVFTEIWNNNVEKARKMFYNEFMAPGHVPILLSRGLDKRRGHTELSTTLALLASLVPSIVLAEMLDKGESLSLEKAFQYAKKNDIVIIDGESIINYWRRSEQ